MITDMGSPPRHPLFADSTSAGRVNCTAPTRGRRCRLRCSASTSRRVSHRASARGSSRPRRVTRPTRYGLVGGSLTCRSRRVRAELPALVHAFALTFAPTGTVRVTVVPTRLWPSSFALVIVNVTFPVVTVPFSSTRSHFGGLATVVVGAFGGFGGLGDGRLRRRTSIGVPGGAAVQEKTSVH